MSSPASETPRRELRTRQRAWPRAVASWLAARGVKDFGTALSGHGGVLDRIDSLCFAAPIFFHITAFFFGV